MSQADIGRDTCELGLTLSFLSDTPDARDGQPLMI